MLFVGAKVSQFALLPQGQSERMERVEAMVAAMDEAGFGSCTNTYACERLAQKEFLYQILQEWTEILLNQFLFKLILFGGFFIIGLKF